MTPIRSEIISEGKQIENLRESYALLSTCLPIGHADFLNRLSSLEFDHVDPFVLLDTIANGTALDLLNLLNPSTGDITEEYLQQASMVNDEYNLEEESPEEEWDLVE